MNLEFDGHFLSCARQYYLIGGVCLRKALWRCGDLVDWLERNRHYSMPQFRQNIATIDAGRTYFRD